MEGLIPFVYKSLKKSHTRRKYECLSSDAAQPYNIADFYAKADDDLLDRDYVGRRGYATPGPDDVPKPRGAHHRRCSSVVVDGRHGAGGFAWDGGAPPPPPKKQIVRFRSHRMLSCITGA